MEFHIGEKIKYFFPNPKAAAKPYFIGVIEDILENHIVIKNEDSVTLKVSLANFDLLRPVDSNVESSSSITENFVG